MTTKNIQDVVAERVEKVLEQVKEVEAESNARYIADLYKIHSYFNYPDPMLKMGPLEIPTNYTIITTMISHLCDKYDVTHEQIKQALTPPTSDEALQDNK